ncbi:PspA/IM30 family protein [Eisenibacter elegans]|jgi:phage shock protein A|uniref:PspA/IM30 family protein n=1 Tax=Eisenibacter elegans TaxID=997 RepID=UPI0004064614|nr:PspA/IM30 family protein [Eisenibacter elegans]
MGIFGRISDIFKSNVNDALDKMEDPEKMIKQMIIEMQEGLSKATSSLATAMAQEKKMEREYNKHAQAAQEWESKAAAALNAGKEDLARQALSQKAQHDGQAAQYKQMFDHAASETRKLREMVDNLKAKLNEAKMKESTLIARSQMAKTQKKLAKEVGSFDASSNFSKFDKFEEKILKAEAEAQAFTELASDGSASLNDEFKQLAQSSQVDDELAKLRAKLNQGQ